MHGAKSCRNNWEMRGNPKAALRDSSVKFFVMPRGREIID
ncbi:hypothetical protein DESME_04565 [Desulfitobacterium metallireducens DSM 15288]|uniref:Uncharacterized protein n=1 Tax=Desulfitobacterium metallireducens DSM 15288 TaxID=871968 RepID=W0EC77_9FIRM|nr:hypothetical protein DESME_04565 [Desulfitobacterium metallireducens DSM 15288]